MSGYLSVDNINFVSRISRNNTGYTSSDIVRLFRLEKDNGVSGKEDK